MLDQRVDVLVVEVAFDQAEVLRRLGLHLVLEQHLQQLQVLDDGTKVINLIKSIEKLAEENSDDPYLIAMAERARAVQERFGDGDSSRIEVFECTVDYCSAIAIR